MIEIKKGVPPPKRVGGGGRTSVYPFDGMKPGTHIDVEPKAGESLTACCQRARTAAASWRNRRGPLLSFIVRYKDEQGKPILGSKNKPVVRIWAVKPEDSISPANIARKKK